MKRLLWLLIALAIFAVGAAVLWPAAPAVPSWVEFRARSYAVSGGALTLSDGKAALVVGGETVWRSEEGVRVQDLLMGDIDRDGAEEAMLLCWRRGRYGESRPFWEEEEKNPDWTQHIFLYDLDPRGLTPVWMASDIGLEAVRWWFDEAARLVIVDRTGRWTAWDWLSWGLTAIDAPEETAVSAAALGELIVHRQIYEYALNHENGRFDGLFAQVAPILSAYDFTSIHQESILVADRADYSSYPFFGAPMAVGEAVIDAGFDVVSLASNHALDKGGEAIDHTAALYGAAGVLCAGIQSADDGAYRPYTLWEGRGIRVAVLGFTQTTNGHALPEDAPYRLHTLDDEAAVARAVAAARNAADFVVIYVHWGTEYQERPDESQLAWARRFANWGADVVIGTHPHVLQPVEWVQGADGHAALVYYSLGNFLSAQTDPACRLGAMARFTMVKTPQGCTVRDDGLLLVETREENGHYTAVLQE